MIPSLRLQLVAAAVAAVAAGSVPATTHAVRANELCYGAGVSGTVTGEHDAPTVCQSTSLPVTCLSPATGVSPTIGVHGQVCVPD